MEITKDGKLVGKTSEIEVVSGDRKAGIVFWTRAPVIEGQIYRLHYDDGRFDDIRIGNGPPEGEVKRRHSYRVSADFVTTRPRKP